MGMFMRVLVAPRRAEEGQEHQPPAVEAGEQRRDDQRPEGDAPGRARIGAFDDRVLRQEPGKTDMGQRNAHPGDRQRPDQHRPERIGHLRPQTAIVPHVLLVMHPVDDRTGPEEQHRLEEGVGQQVEHRHRIDADTGGHEHVAQLRTGRIGDHALDVVLHEAHRRREEGRDGADIDDDHLRFRSELEDRRHPADKEHPRRHHGRRVDEGRDRCRAFHRVRQPRVQDELRRLAHRANEQQEGDQVRGVPVCPEEGQLRLGQLGRGGEHGVELDRVRQVEQREDPQRKAEIPDPVDHEGLDRGGIGGRLAEIEPDQQVGREANPLPAKEHLREVVRRHQHQHREGEQRQVGKEPGPIALGLVVEVLVMSHVAHRIKVHERRDGRHHDQHDRRQPV